MSRSRPTLGDVAVSWGSHAFTHCGRAVSAGPLGLLRRAHHHRRAIIVVGRAAPYKVPPWQDGEIDPPQREHKIDLSPLKTDQPRLGECVWRRRRELRRKSGAVAGAHVAGVQAIA